MEVIPIAPRGFCKGVFNAIRLAKKTALENPQVKITVLGQLVHNRYVSEALKLLNIDTLNEPHASRTELLSKIKDGIVIFTAHGVSSSIREEALRRNLKIVDATCDDVWNTHALIKSAQNEGQTLFYIGKAGHPETQGIMDSFSEIYLIERTEDVPDIGKHHKIFVTNQTTMSKNDIEHIIHAIIKQYPQAHIANEICAATRLRQQAVERIPDADVLIVVGDPRSNNTQMLAKIATQHGIANVHRIESIEQLDTALLKKNMRIAVTSGASTPAKLTRQVIDYLNDYDFDHPAPLPRVDITTLLDE